MMIGGIQIRRRVFVSVGLMIAVTGVWLYWSRATQTKINPEPSGQPDAFVRIVGAGEGARDRLLEERAEYFDPTPLFLPTSKNYQQGPLPSRVMKTPGQVFRDFEPKWHFVETTLPEYGVSNEAGSGTLQGVLARGVDAPFAGFGRVDPTSPPLARRSGFMEVKSLKNGKLSLTETLEGVELPLVDYAWVEFMVVVASAGLIGDPVLISSSGHDEVDGKLKDYLVKIYRIGERLAPGRYVVLIGP